MKENDHFFGYIPASEQNKAAKRTVPLTPIRIKLLEVLIKHQEEEPNLPVPLTELEKEVDLSRQGLSLAYNALIEIFPDILPQRPPKRRPAKSVIFDIKVRDLLDQAKSDAEIASLLGATESKIYLSRGRLGLVHKPTDHSEIDREILKLRNRRNLGDKKIAEILHKDVKFISSRLSTLHKKDLAKRLRIIRAYSERTFISTEIKRMRIAGMRKTEIVNQLNAHVGKEMAHSVDEFYVQNEATRLVKEGEIPRRGGRERT